MDPNMQQNGPSVGPGQTLVDPMAPIQPQVVVPGQNQLQQQQIVPGQQTTPNIQDQFSSQQPVVDQSMISAQPGQVQPEVVAPIVSGGGGKKSKVLIVIVIAVIVLAGITVAGLLLAPKKKPAKKATTNTTKTTNESKGPQPATALDVEQSNNSINQDISNPNDDNDFPPNQLDDKSLGL
jgi:hypothetical protein